MKVEPPSWLPSHPSVVLLWSIHLFSPCCCRASIWVMCLSFCPCHFHLLSVGLFALFIFSVYSVLWVLSIHSIYPVDILVYLYSPAVPSLPFLPNLLYQSCLPSLSAPSSHNYLVIHIVKLPSHSGSVLSLHLVLLGAFLSTLTTYFLHLTSDPCSTPLGCLVSQTPAVAGRRSGSICY